MEIKPYLRTINYYETDKMKVTHHSNYLRFMEEARIDFLRQIGCDYDKIEAEGICSPVMNANVNYIRTSTYPETLEITLKVLKCTAVKFVFGYEMKRGDKVVSTAETTHCLMTFDGQPVIIKEKFPELYEKMSAMVEK